MLASRGPRINIPEDDIPVLTSVVRRPAAASGMEQNPVESEAGDVDLTELQIRLSTASLGLADQLIHSAFQEMEAAMFEQVSNRLRDELPALIADILRDHFNAGTKEPSPSETD